MEKIIYTDKDTIGNILPDGTIEKQYHGQGWIYKNFEAFKNKTENICYVSEYDEDEISEGVGYRYKDFVKMAQEFIDNDKEVTEYCKQEETTAEDIAENLFEMVDWQSPETLIVDWEINGSYTE